MAAATGAAVALVTGSARIAVGLCGAVATVLGDRDGGRGGPPRPLPYLRAEPSSRTALSPGTAHRRRTTQEIDHGSARRSLPAALDRLRAGISPRRSFAVMVDGDPA